MEKKTFSSRLNSFKFIAYLIIGMGGAYTINALFNYPDLDKASLIAGVITIVLGIFFYLQSRKTRKIIVDDFGIEYHTSKLMFRVGWDDLMLLKSFQEQGKKSENMVLIDNDENVLTVSDAFFDEYELRNAFKCIADKIKDHDKISIEDDRNWLK